MVSGRPHIPKRSDELTVAAVGGNLQQRIRSLIKNQIKTHSNSIGMKQKE